VRRYDGDVCGRAGVALCLLLALAGCVREDASGTPVIADVWRVFQAGPVPPPDDAPGWERVRLPDFWGIDVRRHAVEGWYRATFRLDAVPDEPWAVYLPRIAQTVAVWMNGEYIGDTGRFTEPLPRHWNRPVLLTVPAALLRPGENVLRIRLATHVGAPGFLRPFHVGPLRVLRPLYDRRMWWQVNVPQIVGGGTLAGGILLLVFALRNPAFGPVGWIALALVLWAWSTADAFFRETRVPTLLWEWSTAAALIWFPVAFVLGFHRLLGRPQPRLERGMVLAATVMCVTLLVVPRLYFFTVMLVLVGLALAMAIYIVWLAARRGMKDARRPLLLVPTVIAVLVGVHDVSAAVSGTALLGVILSPYLPLVAIVATAWSLLDRHLESVRETEALNRTLEGRVEEKHAELERNYEQLRRFERERAVAGERERIMQDVHDGVGGQLVSALAMVEGGRSIDAVSDVLRGALEDLRLVIDSLDPTEYDLLAVLGAVRARLEPRLGRHGLTMRWEVREVAVLPGFGPEMALQVMRVVQEAVTNVVKHAAARTITVRTGDAAEDGARAGVFVEIRDDGRGYRSDAPRGRGLASMERRAQRLRGRLVVAGTESGTVVRLWIPTDAG
jgi:signal transduction histidine kinase